MYKYLLYFCFALFCVLDRDARGLLLALHFLITPGGAQGII